MSSFPEGEPDSATLRMVAWLARSRAQALKAEGQLRASQAIHDDEVLVTFASDLDRIAASIEGGCAWRD